MKPLSVWGRGPSAVALARALEVKRNSPARVVVRWKELEVPRRLEGRRRPWRRPEGEINSGDAIRAASHKFESLKVMEEAGVRVPKAALFKDVDPSQLDFPVLGRDNYHTKGTDIVFYDERNIREIRRHDYFIEYLKPSKEYRYHVAFGKVILPTVKVKAGGEDGELIYTDDSIIRNHQGGEWEQVVTTKDGEVRVQDYLEKQALMAVEAHGLDFGAVDIIMHKKHAYVLEVNTAPGLFVENRLVAYRDAIRERVEEILRRG